MMLEEPATGLQLLESLARSGYALLSPSASAALTGVDAAGWQALGGYWDNLPRDAHLKDAGRYRSRRHGSFIHDVAEGRLTQVPHRAHWQPVQYNALHGGMSRWFEPLEASFIAHAGVRRVITAVGDVATRCTGTSRWFVEVHQVRIDTAGGIGRPTPEGAHRDGVDFVAVWLAGCRDVRGGETRVFDAAGPSGVRFTMREAGTAMVLDDHRVIHETTPIQPDERAGVRDTLIVTCRAGGFQEPQGPVT